MSSDALVLRTHGLCKQFRAGMHHRSVFRAIRAQLARGSNGGPSLSLDSIDIALHAGETIGLVGQNGAGKTTLLKTISGLYRQSAGTIEYGGDVALLAGLGAGMVDELSVKDNVYLYGAVCRVPRATIKREFRDILGWADLERYEDAELRTLSTGMRTRLAFAIAMHIDSALLCMDEAFSAGDKRFQSKCDEYFRKSRSTGRTVLVATHNLEFVEEFCDRTLWLHLGKQMAIGSTDVVLPKYVDFCAK